MSKLAIFLCAVLFASAANASSWSDALEAVQQKVAAAIDATINKVSDLFKAARAKAEEIFKKLSEKASESSKKIKEKVEEILEKIEAEIAEIIGKDHGVDITECRELLYHLEYTGLAVIANMSLCVTDKLETGAGYIGNMVELTEDVIANLTVIKEEAYHCGDNVDGLTSAAAALICVNKAAAKATWISVKVVPELSIEFAKLNFLLGTLQPSLVHCTANNGFVTFYEESATIVDRTKSCIQEKIDEVRGNEE